MKLKESTVGLYDRVLKKIDVSNVEDLQDYDLVVSRINSLNSNSYKIMAYRAINWIVEQENSPMLDYSIYQKEYKKLVQLQNNKNNIGSLPMTLSELLSIEVKCPNELQQVVESFTIWINTHHPLRLDYYNVEIKDCLSNQNPAEKENCINYMTYANSVLTFYLNDFKNVHSFGPQVITYDSPVICSYLAYLTNYFGYLPEFLLWRYDKGNLAVFSSRIYYGEYLRNLLKKHTGFDMSMNTIRKIHESALIQSPEYAKMTNQEKQKKHSLLLHSMNTANNSYNIIS